MDKRKSQFFLNLEALYVRLMTGKPRILTSVKRRLLHLLDGFLKKPIGSLLFHFCQPFNKDRKKIASKGKQEKGRPTMGKLEESLKSNCTMVENGERRLEAHLITR